MRITDYKSIFSSIEDSLRKHFQMTENEFHDRFSNFTDLQFNRRSDQVYFDKMKMIVFYSGFNALTVSKKESRINEHFGYYKIVANYNDSDKKYILSDKLMIRKPSKINAVINNAKEFVKIIQRFGSFHDYIDSFSPTESFENLMLLKEDLECRFEYLGGITVFHFLMDIGLDVIKPDRVITRIFERIGVIEYKDQYLKTIFHGRKFAEATGHPIRYIDIVLVSYGQQGDSKNQMDGICLEKSPKCEICGVRKYCQYLEKN